MDAVVAGPLFMLSAVLLFTLLDLLIKLLSPVFNTWHIGFYRFAGGLAILLAVFTPGRNPFKGSSIGLLIVRGCTGSVAFISLITAIRMLPISTVMVIFTAAVGIVFLNDPTSLRFWTGGVMIFCSIIVLNRLRANAKIEKN